MSAELLREAAALMRERAEYADNSPWAVELHDDGRTWINVPDDPHAFALHGSPSSAKHIASWHPAIALLVADLLSMAGDHAAGRGNPCDSCVEKSAELARAYLGRDA